MAGKYGEFVKFILAVFVFFFYNSPFNKSAALNKV